MADSDTAVDELIRRAHDGDGEALGLLLEKHRDHLRGIAQRHISGKMAARVDGYEVARRLRDSSETRYCLLVAVSGYGQEEHRRRATAAGFDHHFVKPVNCDELLHAVAQGATAEFL